MDRSVWLNGGLVPWAEAKVSVFERGFTIGDGVFETIPVVRGAAVRLPRHLSRLLRSCEVLGIDSPGLDELTNAAETLIFEFDTGELSRYGVLRLSVTGGEPPAGIAGRGPWRGGPATCVAFVEQRQPPTPHGPAAEAITGGPFTRDPSAPAAGLKSVSYANDLLALRWAVARGYDEYAFLTPGGELCEGTRSNLLVSVGEEWLTPRLESGCLPGIAREALIEAGLVTEAELVMTDRWPTDRAELRECSLGPIDELVWISAAGGVRFRRDQGVADQPGPLATAAWDLLSF